MKRLACVLLVMGLLGACDDAGVQASDVDAMVIEEPDAAPPPPDAAPPDAEPAPDAIVSLACSLDEVQPLAECALENCQDVAGDTEQLLTCLAFRCAGEFITLSPQCLECALAAASGDTAAILQACLNGPQLPV
jgi:hypothetical protein